MTNPFKQWIQDRLPIFLDPIIVGDEVRVKELLPENDDAEFSDIVFEYVGQPGRVVGLQPDHPGGLQYSVRFIDDYTWQFSEKELERL